IYLPTLQIDLISPAISTNDTPLSCFYQKLPYRNKAKSRASLPTSFLDRGADFGTPNRFSSYHITMFYAPLPSALNPYFPSVSETENHPANLETISPGIPS